MLFYNCYVDNFSNKMKQIFEMSYVKLLYEWKEDIFAEHFMQ